MAIGRKKINTSMPSLLPIATPIKDIKVLIINNTKTYKYKVIYLYKENAISIRINIIYGPTINGPEGNINWIISPVGKSNSPKNTTAMRIP